MIKDIFKYGLTATVTALFCCVAPTILFAIGIGSGIFAFQFADFFYNTDGSANIYGWILRGAGVLVVAWGIYKYNKKENCTLNTPKQKRTNKIIFALILLSVFIGGYFLLTELTTQAFEWIDITRQAEYDNL